ncbi:MAG: hypothetical protein KatS3mg076_0003 [Candidatus Binatia bacterium]|nr:MAG: hypothetical protein KatS3mg076_0003 [Candidatus Binatia bacterium]
MPSETPTPRSDLTVASLNILHGLTCPPETEFCRLADRVELFFQWIVAAGCPDFVNVQEVLGGVLALVREKAGSACPFPYEIVESSKSQNIVLSRYPVLASRTESLHGGVRLVLHVRVDHPIGPVDVFTTHLAASIDGGNAPCGPVCPEECIGAGAATNRDCQAVQVRRFVEKTHDLGTPAVVTGDFNAPPGSFVYEQFVGAGWIDAYLEAGNPECDPATGVGCTSGRQDENLVDMESPENGVDERIDFAFVVPPREPAICNFEIDPAEDADGDGLGTRIFADLPNPFVPECGPRPLPICWPSDHEGMQVDLNCLP